MYPFRRLFALTLLLALVFPGSLSSSLASSSQWQSKVDAWVLSSNEEEPAEFILMLREQADLSGAAALKTKAEKGAYVFAQLAGTARRTQASLLDALAGQGVEFRSYWIANMVWVKSDRQTVEWLARRSDVAHIYANPAVLQPEYASQPEKLNLLPQNVESAEVEPNLVSIGVLKAWQRGYTGQGVVIGGQDTGYDWQHQALQRQYRGWNGSAADHNYNWHDAIHTDNPNTAEGNLCGFDSQEPCDDGHHGTHTMGIMTGESTERRTGVAPEARWIGCRNMEQNVGTPASYAECYQWFLAPTDLNGQNPRPDLAPDIINNSWGCPPSEGCTDPGMLEAVVNSVRAAGILTVHSAGNSGPGCASISSPAGIYDASFTVGATLQNGEIWSGSGRGPVTADGSGRIKPDVTAPGISITSTISGGGYASLSGTSMAAPHAAGLAALVLSARPDLAGQVDEIEAIVTGSAVPVYSSESCGGLPAEAVPNNTYGWGHISADGAIDLAVGPANFLYLPYFRILR